MGSLILPPSGVVYVDSQVLIYSIERHQVYAPLTDPIWHAARANTITVYTSTMAVMECLVHPLRNGDVALQREYERALFNTELKLVDVALPLLREAARLRAIVPALRTPDAIHAASALAVQAGMLVTNDVDLKRVPGVVVTMLNDVLNTP